MLTERDMVRFYRHVRPTGFCWEWVGAKTQGGYGRVGLPGNTSTTAHRWVYEVLIGPIPEGLHLDHLCRNRGCVNPDHVEPVTNAENHARGTWALRTHCSRGHEYTPENTYRWPKKPTGRYCRACWEVRKSGKQSTQTGATQPAVRPAMPSVPIS